MAEGVDQKNQAEQQPSGEEDPLKRFEALVTKYGRAQNLNMFKYFHSSGFNVKHPPNVNTISYILDGNYVKVSCKCGASLDLTDYSKADKV